MVQGLQTLSYNEKLEKLELSSPEYCRRRLTMIKMFKIGYKRYGRKATKNMFELNNRDKRTNGKKVITKKANFELQKFFFTIRAATDWNMLPEEIIDSKTLNAFKNNLDKHWKKSGINKFETN